MTWDEQPEFAMPCPECRAGVSHLRYQTFMTWVQDHLITVPNFPTWVCDVCGWREVDHRALNWLTTLVNPPYSRSEEARLRTHPEHSPGDSPRPAAE